MVWYLLTNRFKLVGRDEFTNKIKLAEYATPYPKKPNDEKRKFLEKPDDRNAFIRDRDRILHCVSFRKMLGKTQVFISEKNPMQRNRLTHTMEVWQISNSIARKLNANVHLTEAIAFGHDLGHTPFGHAGESVLNLLMENDELEGFSHNEQSVRVVSKLESYPNVHFLNGEKTNGYGLNLTSFTREGLFKHTSRFKDCKNKELIEEFSTDNGSIEAQIVNVSDEIAQCTHDLQDVGMANAIPKEEVQSIFKQFSKILGTKPERGKQTISMIIGVLINDVSNESINKLNETYFGNSGKEQYITFSKEGNRLQEHIQKLIKENGILGDEVNKMNSRGRNIIKELYYMFIDDPYCLPKKEVKDRFSRGLQKKLNDPKGYGKTKVLEKDDIRVVCDYIASLTDKQAIDAFHSTLL